MSVYGDILDAVKTVVQGLSLANLPPASVVVRKTPVYLAEHDPVPLVVISPVLEGLDGLAFGDQAFTTYEVRVTVYHEAAFNWEALDWLLDVRERIRKALFVTTLAGAPTVMDAAWLPQPTYDAAGLSAGVDVSRQGFVYTSSEGRTT